MKNYIAFYKDENNNMKFMQSKYNEDEDFHYSNMKQYEKDLKSNGYRKIVAIYTQEKVQHIADTDYIDLMKEVKYSKYYDYLYQFIKECAIDYIK
jgi:hypothetical protein